MTYDGPPFYVRGHTHTEARTLASKINEEKITSYFACLTLCNADTHTCKRICREVLTTL